MNKLLSLGFGLLLLLLTTPAFCQQAQVIAPAVFSQKVNAIAKPQLIDVRTPGEYAGGHLAKSQLVTLGSSDFQQKLAALDKNQPVFVYCAVGGRSRNASQTLLSMGFKQVYDLQGGIHAWVGARLPVAK